MRSLREDTIAAGVMLVALASGAATPWAQDKEAVVTDRQATMKAQAAALGGVKKYLDGDADSAAGTKSAEDLLKIARSLPEKFPAGTGNAEVPRSHAKPIIWTDHDEFLAAQKNLVAQ